MYNSIYNDVSMVILNFISFFHGQPAAGHATQRRELGDIVSSQIFWGKWQKCLTPLCVMWYTIEYARQGCHH